MSEIGRDDDAGEAEAVVTAPPNGLLPSLEVTGDCQWRIDIGSDCEELEEDEAEEWGGREIHEGDGDQLPQQTNGLLPSHEVTGDCQWRTDIGSDCEELEEDEAEEGGEIHEGDGNQLPQQTIGEFGGEHGARPVENKLRGAIAGIIEDKDLKRLPELQREHGGAKQLAFILGSDPKFGVVEELDTIITVSKLPHFILKACRKGSMVLLSILALETLASGMAEEGLQGGWLLGCLPLLFWIGRIASASICCFCRARKMERRLNEKNKSAVTVIRSLRLQEIRLCDIVEGDIVSLTADNRIPANGVLIYDNGLVLDGILHNKAGGFPFLYFGSEVIEGEGLMLVTSVGINTEQGKLMRLLANIKDDDDLPVEVRLKKPNPYADIRDLKKEKLVSNWINKTLDESAYIGLITSIITDLVKFILSLRGKTEKNDLGQELKSAAGVEGLLKIFNRLLNNGGKGALLLATSMATMVLVLQPGIKMVISTYLGKLNGKRGPSEQFCQNSPAFRTLGITSVIFMDISATLMFQKREVSRFQIGQKDIIGGNCTSKMSQTVLEPLIQGVGASVLVPKIGSPSKTDSILISWVERKWNVNMKSELKERFNFVCYGKLRSNKEGRGVLLQRKGNGENIWDSHWKGGANTILGMCSNYYDCEGQIHDIKNQKTEFEQVIKEMEGNGMRPIAFAYKQTDVQELVEDELCLLAIVGVKYQCHEEMKSIVWALRSGGRNIILVSRDKLSTLKAMAWELGITSPGSKEGALEGHEFRKLFPDAMMERVDRITMLRSSSPWDKLLMVNFLKQKGHVVGFIGGWTTLDAQVLQEADVGITIATWSPIMNREVSDIVLTSDSSFSSLITILESGAQEYHKIQRSIQIQNTSNISVIVITSIETIFLGESSITFLQVLYLNLVLEVFGVLMFVRKLQHKELWNNQAGNRKGSVITKLMRINILLQASFQVIVFLLFSFKGEALHISGMNTMNQEVRKAMIFNGFLLFQVFSHFHPFFDLGNYLFSLFLVPFTAIHVLLFTELWLKLTWMEWAFCFLIAVSSWWINSATVLISIYVK